MSAYAKVLTRSKPVICLAAAVLMVSPSFALAANLEEDLLATGQIVGYNSATAHPGTISGFEVIPSSNLPKVKDGMPALHTHLRILIPANGQNFKPVSHDEALENLKALNRNSEVGPSGQNDPFPGSFANTPSSLACIYNLAPQPEGQPAGCNPLYTSVNPAGGSGAIAVVEAYDHPTAEQDLAYFSQYFNLPAANFQVAYVGGVPPGASDSGWSTETALDLEWAHAMAPYAKIILVECPSEYVNDEVAGAALAQQLVAQNGGGEVSMSFGATDFSGESSYDSTLANAPSNIVQFASAGDHGSVVNWPSASPYVISVGGTTLNRTGSGDYIGETVWSDTGGGLSAYESRPSFQSGVTSIVGSSRGTPDISMLANPQTGVPVYAEGSWGNMLIGGTSLASPLAAGVFNLGTNQSGFPSQATAFQALYANGASGDYSRDIISGSCGTNSAMAGYDLCTGWGSLISYPYDTNGPPKGSVGCYGARNEHLMTVADIKTGCSGNPSRVAVDSSGGPSGGIKGANGASFSGLAR